MAYYIAEGAVVKGQVTMADGASVWYNATVRGDSEPAEIRIYRTMRWYMWT